MLTAIATWAPAAIFLVAMWWLATSVSKKSQRIRERSFEHMERCENQNQLIIGLLEEIRDGRTPPSG